MDKINRWYLKPEKGHFKMRYFFAVILAALPFAYLGCSKTPKEADDARFHDERVVLQSGDHILTLGEINKHFAGVKFESPEKEYKAKEDFAEETFGRYLLIDGAKEAGLTAEIDSATITQARLNELYKRKIMSKIHVTDKDVDDFFKQYGGQIEAAQIVLNDSLRADSLYRLLKKGEDFEKLARSFSKDEWHGPKGGNIGYISYNASGGKIMDIAFGLKMGEFSEPINVGSRWLILKVYDRIKNTKEDLDENRINYDNLASQHLQKQEMTKFAEEVRSQFHFRIVEPTVQMLIQKTDSVETAGNGSAEPSYPATLDASCFSKAQVQMPIAEYDGGAYTVSDYLGALRGASQARPPDPRDSAALNEYLQKATINAMLDLMARKEKIDQDKNFQRGLEYQRENILVQQMTGKIYQDMGQVSEADAKKYYEEHPDKFYAPDQIRASAIAVKTRDEAQDLLQRARNGANFFMLARKFSLDRKSAYEGGDIGFFTVARYTPIYQAGENLKKGEFGGPVEFEGNWWIFKVTDRVERYHMSFDLAGSNVYSQASVDMRTKAMYDFFDKMKEKIHYTRDYDLLKNNLFTGPLADTGKGIE
jgi:parvulin-like peptidyl-prolyl isomerase